MAAADHRALDERLHALRTRLGHIGALLEVAAAHAGTVGPHADPAAVDLVRRNHGQVSKHSRAAARDAVALAWRSPRVSDVTAAAMVIQHAVDLRRMSALMALVADLGVAVRTPAEREACRELNAEAARLTAQVHRVLLGGDPRALAALSWLVCPDTHGFSRVGRKIDAAYQRYFDRAIGIARRARSRPTWFVRPPRDGEQ